PYADFYDGMEEARRFFETVLASVDIHVFDTQEFLSDGDKVVVTGVLHLTAKSTGCDIKSDFVHVITMKDGKWSKFRDFMDTHEAVNAFGE
ncbi:MAG: nuclear transport factor 2 family protein, partial [Parvibaculaceae bacterium]|nr:nuclear transport factor 2 family protein [Parvibaculaceae bacterium]